MKIRLVDSAPSLATPLKAFAERHQLLFHSDEWTRSYDGGGLAQCAILNNNDEIIGCFLYYSFRKYGFSFVISPPYCPDIALFFVNPAQSVVGRNTFEKELMTALAAYFLALRADYLNINLPREVTDTQPFTWAGFVARARYTYIIDLSQPVDELRANLSSEKRKSISKAEKDGLSVVESYDTSLIYHLVTASLGRSGKLKNTGPLGRIIKIFARPERSIAYVAWNGSEPVSAVFCLIEGGKAIYLLGGISAAGSHHGASVSCMWNCMLRAKEAGLKYFDFEGSMNPGIERYFREFGGTLQAYHCVEKIRPLLRTLLYLKKEKLF